MKTYILHWKTGELDRVSGKDIVDAMNHAGYGAGAVAALDYYEEVEKRNLTSRRSRAAKAGVLWKSPCFKDRDCNHTKCTYYTAACLTKR